MKITQREVVLDHLVEYGAITTMEAMREYGIMRLASRVSELRRQGYEIRSRIETSRNRYGDPVHYAVYSLAEGNEKSKKKATGGQKPHSSRQRPRRRPPTRHFGDDDDLPF